MIKIQMNHDTLPVFTFQIDKKEDKMSTPWNIWKVYSNVVQLFWSTFDII